MVGQYARVLLLLRTLLETSKRARRIGMEAERRVLSKTLSFERISYLLTV